jgi:hypothetical protein
MRSRGTIARIRQRVLPFADLPAAFRSRERANVGAVCQLELNDHRQGVGLWLWPTLDEALKMWRLATLAARSRHAHGPRRCHKPDCEQCERFAAEHAALPEPDLRILAMEYDAADIVETAVRIGICVKRARILGEIKVVESNLTTARLPFVNPEDLEAAA